MGGMDGKGIPQYYLPLHWWAHYGGRECHIGPKASVWKQVDKGRKHEQTLPCHTNICTQTYNGSTDFCLPIGTSANKRKPTGGEACAGLRGCPTRLPLSGSGKLAVGWVSSCCCLPKIPGKGWGKAVLQRVCPLSPSRKRVLGAAKQSHFHIH